MFFILWLVFQDEIEALKRKEVQASVRQALGGKSDEASRKPFGSRKDDSDEDEADFDSRMRRQILEKKSQLAVSKASDTVKSGILCSRFTACEVILFIPM